MTGSSKRKKQINKPGAEETEVNQEFNEKEKNIQGDKFFQESDQALDDDRSDSKLNPFNLIDGFDKGLERWFLEHKGFTQEETNVLISQLQEHQQKVEAEGWQPLTFFLIDILEKDTDGIKQRRTTVYSGNGAFSSWENPADNQWQDTVSEQLCQSVVDEIEKIPPLLSPIQSVSISVLQVKFIPTQSEVPVELQIADSYNYEAIVLSSDEPFDLEVSFKVDGLSSKNLLERTIAYQLLCDVKEQMTGAKILLTDKDALPIRLTNIQDSYIARLQKIHLKRGEYRLRIAVLLQGTPGCQIHNFALILV